jgi:hypothetical protein
MDCLWQEKGNERTDAVPGQDKNRKQRARIKDHQDSGLNPCPLFTFFKLHVHGEYKSKCLQ